MSREQYHTAMHRETESNVELISTDLACVQENDTVGNKTIAA